MLLLRGLGRDLYHKRAGGKRLGGISLCSAVSGRVSWGDGGGFVSERGGGESVRGKGHGLC